LFFLGVFDESFRFTSSPKYYGVIIGLCLNNIGHKYCLNGGGFC